MLTPVKLYNIQEPQLVDVSAPAVSVRLIVEGAYTPESGVLSIEDMLNDRIIKAEIETQKSTISVCKITFWNEDLALLDTPIMRKGTIMSVSWGYPGYSSKPRRFKVKDVKGTTARISNHGHLTIIGESKEQALHTKQRSHTYKNKTASEVAKIVARRNGFRGSGLDVDETTERRTFFQVNKTDAQYLVELAQSFGMYWAIEGDVFLFKRQESKDQGNPISHFEFFDDETGWIKRFEPQTTIVDQPGSITLESRTRGGKSVSFTATPKTKGKRSLGKYVEVKPAQKAGFSSKKEIVKTTKYRNAQGEIITGTSGISGGLIDSGTSSISGQLIPNEVRKSPSKSGVRKSKPGVDPTGRTLSKPGASAKQLKREAKVRMQNVGFSPIKARVVLVGDPDLWRGQLISLGNLTDGLNGLWVIVNCTHYLDSRGYEVELKVRKDAKNTLGRGVKGSTSQKVSSRNKVTKTAKRVKARKTSSTASRTGYKSKKKHSKR